MRNRILPLLLALGLLACTAHPSLAAGKKHHHHANAAAQGKAQALAAHLVRLAAKEKKEWRDHLAKLRALPRAERHVVLWHNRLWQRQHNAKVAAMQAHQARLAALEAKQARRLARSLAKAAHGRRHKTLLASHSTQSAPARKHAALAAAHQAALARKQAASQAHLAKIQAVRLAILAKQQAAFHARLVNLQAARNARLAAGRAHWIALHGDGSGGKSIRFWQTGAAGVPVKVISVDLNDRDIKVSAVMAQRGNGTAEPFRQMIARANPNVAVTGTFFSLGDLQPIGDIVIDGDLVHFGGMGTALCITPNNHAQMVTCDWGRHHDWSQFDFVVACGPRLLRHGRVVLDARAERFRDLHMLSPNSRIAVGITSGNTLFFVMTHQPISLGRLARVMQALGAKDAMNLDAGTSTGFYCNGATLARPGRQLTNMIVVYGRKARYERALDQLIPASYRRPEMRVRRQISQALPAPARSASLRLVRQ